MDARLKKGVVGAMALLAAAFASSSLAQNVILAPRVFTGVLQYDSDAQNIFGSVTAQNPTCTLTTTTDTTGVHSGEGPNGSISLSGSSECAGTFYLYLSGGFPFSGTFGDLGPANPQGTFELGNGGIASGSFAIVESNDNKTVKWAGTYTQVATEINGSCAFSFCSNVISTPSEFDAIQVQLNGFTWNVPSH